MAALTDDILTFVAADSAEPAEARQDLHSAICAFAVVRTSLRPVVPSFPSCIKNGLADSGLELNSRGLNTNMCHAGDRSSEQRFGPNTGAR